MWAPQPNARLTTPHASLLDVGFNRAHISPQSSSSIPRTNKRNNGKFVLLFSLVVFIAFIFLATISGITINYPK